MRKISAFLIDLLYYIIGGLIYSFSVISFISANEISPGGITGIATVINYLFKLPIGTVVFVLNIPLLIIGFIKFGGIFIFKTTIATAVISVILDVIGGFVPNLIVEPILASVFGGILMGLGISIIMLRGATTGGVDIIAKLINRRFPHMTVGRLMLLTDAFVVAISALVYKNVESALFSVIALYTSSKIMDMVLYGSDKGKIIYIITNFPDSMSKEIMSTVKRGLTILNVTGGYTGEQKKMLMCTCRRNEVSTVYRIARLYDINSFIIVGEAGEIYGEGFKPIIK